MLPWPFACSVSRGQTKATRHLETPLPKRPKVTAADSRAYWHCFRVCASCRRAQPTPHPWKSQRTTKCSLKTAFRASAIDTQQVTPIPGISADICVLMSLRILALVCFKSREASVVWKPTSRTTTGDYVLSKQYA